MKVALLTFSLFLFTDIGYSQCQNFTMTLVGHDPNCHDFTDGGITVTTSGGNGTLTFTITDSTGAIFNPIPGGTDFLLPGDKWYYVEVIDDSSCYIIDSVYLVNPPPIIAQISYVDPTSLGACDGIATVDTVMNNQGAYSGIAFFWSPGGPSGVGENVKNDCCNAFYDLTIVDAIGCSYYEEIASGSAGISDGDLELTVYPNPTTGNIYIESNGLVILKVEMYDLSGKLILKFDNIDEIDLSTVNKGQYYLAITTEYATYKKKILKK